MINRTNIRARYAETDQMGIIYHANYFTWFEIGRTGFFRELKSNYRKLEEENVLLPVIDVGCRYIEAAKYDDEIIIITKLDKIKGVKLRFKYQVIRKDDEKLLAEGYTEHAFVDKDLKPVNFRRKFKDIWLKLEETIE